MISPRSGKHVCISFTHPYHKFPEDCLYVREGLRIYILKRKKEKEKRKKKKRRKKEKKEKKKKKS